MVDEKSFKFRGLRPEKRLISLGITKFLKLFQIS